MSIGQKADNGTGIAMVEELNTKYGISLVVIKTKAHLVLCIVYDFSP